jgi:hypothetical protein
MRRCLEECDIVAIRKLWKHIAPHLHQPITDHEAEITIHRARTEMPSMQFRLRAYSHRWLVDSGYPSALPDDLRPRAERMYPKVVEGVGIAVKSCSVLLRPFVPMIRQSMSDAVMDIYSNDRGHVDPSIVKERIAEIRKSMIKKLLSSV